MIEWELRISRMVKIMKNQGRGDESIWRRGSRKIHLEIEIENMYKKYIE